VEAGAWVRSDRARASLTLAAQRTRLDTAAFATTPDGFTVELARPTARPLVAVDATTDAEWRSSSLDLAGSASLRRAPRQAHGVLGSIYASAAWWLVPRVALTVAAGDLAADPLHGFPARRLTAIGVRWRAGGAPARAVADRPRAAAPAPTPSADVSARGTTRVLRVRAPGATRVEVRGDFTGWHPVALARATDGGASDVWELPLAAASSTVRLTIRVDGGAWISPANLPSVEDEFGERSGLLVVP
jgi:hypothetical protein